jgi:hypothetical protein
MAVASMTCAVYLIVMEHVPTGSQSGYQIIEGGDEARDSCPEITANFISTLTFSWLNALMKLGYSKPLELEDLWYDFYQLL